MPFSLKKKIKSHCSPWWNHWEGKLCLGQGAPWHRGRWPMMVLGGNVGHPRPCHTGMCSPVWNMVRPIFVQGPQAAVLLGRWRIRRWKLVCFTFHGSLNLRGNKNGKAIASTINCVGIAASEMCFPQCFLSVGCKFCIVERRKRANKNLLFHILIFLLYVNIMGF